MRHTGNKLAKLGLNSASGERIKNLGHQIQTALQSLSGAIAQNRLSPTPCPLASTQADPIVQGLNNLEPEAIPGREGGTRSLLSPPEGASGVADDPIATIWLCSLPEIKQVEAEEQE